MRILHAISSDRFAGVEQFVRRLAIAQAGDGHEVAVLGGAASQMSAPLDLAGVHYRPATSVPELARLIRRSGSRADVVNTHMTAADLAAVVGTALMRDRPALVATRHFAQRRGSLGPEFPYRMLERRLDGEISISRAVAEAIGVESTIVHPGIAPRDRNDPAARRRTILVAQRLQREKHTMLALDAFEASGLAQEGWRLQIAGAGPEQGALEAGAVARELADAVDFLGFRSDLPELMGSAGMLLATAPFEHFGLTVLEAMAAGLPIVASDAAGHAEMLAGLDARALFPPEDAAEAGRGLRSLALDPDGRARLGDAERERQQREFSLRAQVDGTDAVYRSSRD